MTVLCIGRATFDLGYSCPVFPAEDSKLSATHFWAGAGGSALNGAVTARALGSEVRLVTMLGRGSFAEAVRGELALYDVRVEDFADKQAKVLPVSSIIVVPEGGTRTIIDQQPEQVVARAVPDDIMDGVKVVYCDGFMPEVAVPVARMARGQGIPVVLDGGSWKPWTGELIPHVDHAIVSERFHPPEQGDAEILASILALGPSFAAVTRGPQPLEWSDGQQRGTITPPPVDAVDTLGAGDIFHGAYCHYLARGEGAVEALEQASVIAAESCRYYGTREWIAGSKA